ncbi:MAG: DNA-binding protein [Nitrospinae bacterium]|nr:DNA-binding protein [Nitrospinota bacterium]
MRAEEKRLGRVFHLEFDEDDDFFGEFERFVVEENIRSGSVIVFGALKESDIRTGFREVIGPSARCYFHDWRELIAVGNISWPEEPPAVRGDETWEEPRPYIHLHLALSGGPYQPGEVLVGHLSGGVVKGMFAEVHEFV